MQEKELRIALVCYGGVSLAVYMHGVTKELWHLARASRDFHLHGPDSRDAAGDVGVAPVYRDLLAELAQARGLQLRVLPDVITGASAGGLNAVFLAQAIATGQSLDALTELWLANADVDQLTAADARPLWRFAKLWAQPLVWWFMRRPGSAVSESVAPETRAEVTRKLSRFMRGRWFQPPFDGLNFSGLILEALTAMGEGPSEAPLLPPGHRLDLLVTATDFHGYRELLRLNSPPVFEETEHRLPLAFSATVGMQAPAAVLADPLELTFAARATASFPGAFPPLQLAEIDALAREKGAVWTGREAFVRRALPNQLEQGTAESTALIDGSVLVNAPFAGARAALTGRPAQREVDRRFVYIDPRPDRAEPPRDTRAPVSFFAAVFGSLSTLPREQPIRDNLEALAQQSREARRLGAIVEELRPAVEQSVDRLFGRTLFLDRPTPRRLQSWRIKAQAAAAREAGFAFQAYNGVKLTALFDRMAQLVGAATDPSPAHIDAVAAAIAREFERRSREAAETTRNSTEAYAVGFLRTHDIAFRVRRLRLIAMRLARDWQDANDWSPGSLEVARRTVADLVSVYEQRDRPEVFGARFPDVARRAHADPAALIDHLAAYRLLPETDSLAEQMFTAMLEQLPRSQRRRVLLSYLGFPFYDVATLPLLRNQGYDEFDPVKVDRISPDDARSIRSGGTRATLRGIEFYNFGAFFSRAYRENDYLWGRLHGAERMIDLVCSTADPLPPETVARFKRGAFLAILDEEEPRLAADRQLIATLRAEVEAMATGDARMPAPPPAESAAAAAAQNVL